MHVLEDERELRLSAVGALALADRAGRRIHEIRAVISLAVVVAGGTKSQRKDKDQKRRRQRPEMVLRIDQRRIEGRKIGSPGIIGTLESPVRRINTECP